jgi:hypothetical protein
MKKRILALMTAPHEKRRPGRPWGSKTNRGSGQVADPLVAGNKTRFYPSVSDIRFDVYVLLNSGMSPEEACREVRDMYGAVVVRKSIERWKRSGYADPSALTIYLPQT